MVPPVMLVTAMFTAGAEASTLKLKVLDTRLPAWPASAVNRPAPTTTWVLEVI